MLVRYVCDTLGRIFYAMCAVRVQVVSVHLCCACTLCLLACVRVCGVYVHVCVYLRVCMCLCIFVPVYGLMQSFAGPSSLLLAIRVYPPISMPTEVREHKRRHNYRHTGHIYMRTKKHRQTHIHAHKETQTHSYALKEAQTDRHSCAQRNKQNKGTDAHNTRPQ